MVEMELPRFVIPKSLSGGRTAFYWNLPKHWRDQGCPLTSGRLGVDLSQAELDEVAADWNRRFEAWRHDLVGEMEPRAPTQPGSVAWLFREYLRSDAFKKRVSEIARADYKNTFEKIIALPTKKGPIDTVGELSVRSITPAAADKIYAAMCEGGTYRKGEKAAIYSRIAWRIMRRSYPQYFPTEVPNPWDDFTFERRHKHVKAAVDRATVYAFANGTTRPELAVAAVICFEWLQRPMNVIANMAWPDYQPGVSIRVLHHKTGKVVLHQLADEDGTLFYPEAEAVLARLPKRGVLMILGPDSQKYQATRFAQLVRREADRLGLPSTFSLDACRHGGMNELERSELTEGQGMALSGHKTPRAYRGYMKEDAEKVRQATRRRMAYRRAGNE